MSDVLDKTRKALAMTASPVAEEARTAAMIVAKLLREHGLLDLVSAPTMTSSTGAATARERAAYDRGYSEGRLAVGATRREEYDRGYRDGMASAEQARATARPPKTGETMEYAVSLEAKYGGFCRVCHRKYFEGESIWWRKDKGAAHLACADATFGA